MSTRATEIIIIIIVALARAVLPPLLSFLHLYLWATAIIRLRHSAWGETIPPPCKRGYVGNRRGAILTKNGQRNGGDCVAWRIRGGLTSSSDMRMDGPKQYSVYP